jgi:hypothetical protein
MHCIEGLRSWDLLSDTVVYLQSTYYPRFLSLLPARLFLVNSMVGHVPSLETLAPRKRQSPDWRFSQRLLGEWGSWILLISLRRPELQHTMSDAAAQPLNTLSVPSSIEAWSCISGT